MTDDMTPGRRSEFNSGRVAAATALDQADWCGAFEIGSDPAGVPSFPGGFIGSIAHKFGRAIAAVSKQGSFVGVGIDLEFDEGLHEGALTSEVVSSIEAPQIRLLRDEHPSLISPATLVLAAKEALFKAVFPITRRDFTFGDAELAFDGKKQSFLASRFPGDEIVRVHGAYEVEARWIVVAAVATAR